MNLQSDQLTNTADVTDSEGVTTQIIRTRTWTATGTRPVYQGVDQTKLIALLTRSFARRLWFASKSLKQLQATEPLSIAEN